MLQLLNWFAETTYFEQSDMHYNSVSMCVFVHVQSPGLLRPTAFLTVQTKMTIKFISSSLKEQKRPQSEMTKEPYTHALDVCVRWDKRQQTPHRYIQVGQYAGMLLSFFNHMCTAAGWFGCLWITHTLIAYLSTHTHTYTLTHKAL